MDYKQCGVRKKCPGCGEMFSCDYERGADCWCATDFPSSAALVIKDEGCHCHNCLKKKLAARNE